MVRDRIEVPPKTLYKIQDHLNELLRRDLLWEALRIYNFICRMATSEISGMAVARRFDLAALYRTLIDHKDVKYAAISGLHGVRLESNTNIKKAFCALSARLSYFRLRDSDHPNYNHSRVWVKDLQKEVEQIISLLFQELPDPTPRGRLVEWLENSRGRRRARRDNTLANIDQADTGNARQGHFFNELPDPTTAGRFIRSRKDSSWRSRAYHDSTLANIGQADSWTARQEHFTGTDFRPYFAFRYWEIKPEALWAEHTSSDLPRPPDQWQKTGFQLPWHIWSEHTVQPLPEWQYSAVMPRRATSVMWCQPQQNYWVVPYDCTLPQEKKEEIDVWHTLFFRDLGLESPPNPGLWKLLEHGLERQHSAKCPVNFDEFLPRNFFNGTDSRVSAPCHLVGNLSLILGLHAMVPQDEQNIPRQIEQYFFRSDEPYLISCAEHGEWSPMNRFGKSPRRCTA